MEEVSAGRDWAEVQLRTEDGIRGERKTGGGGAGRNKVGTVTKNSDWVTAHGPASPEAGGRGGSAAPGGAFAPDQPGRTGPSWPVKHTQRKTGWRNEDPGKWTCQKSCDFKSWPRHSPYVLRRNVMWCWEEERRKKKSKYLMLITEMLCLNNSI